jgi:polyisoprenoid-binding protein YceI
MTARWKINPDQPINMILFVKQLLPLLIIAIMAIPAAAQKYITRTGKVTFFSSTPVENIEAVNNETAGVLDSKTGSVVFQVPIKSFKFEKRLMQDHFNENYMESDTYPKASFKGQIKEPGAIDFAKDGSYQIQAGGIFTIHGVSNTVTLPATLTVKNGTITVFSKFQIKPADYKIKIPSIVMANIAEVVDVTVNTILKKN